MHNLLTSFLPLPLPVLLLPLLPISLFATTTFSAPILTPATLSASSCKAAHDSSSNTFQITNFLTFQSAPSSSSTTSPPITTPQIHTLSFTLLDPQTGTTSTCARSLSPADLVAGAALHDPAHYQLCDDPRLSFVWDGTRLTVSETWNCTGVIGMLVGRLDFLLSCFDMTTAYANGEGTLCELMAESIVGRYTTIWDNTGFYVYGIGPDGKPL